MNLDLTEREAARAARALRKRAARATKKGKAAEAKELETIADKIASAWVKARLDPTDGGPSATKKTTRAKECQFAIERGGHIRLSEEDAGILDVTWWHLKVLSQRQAKIDCAVIRNAQGHYEKKKKHDLVEALRLIGDRLDEIIAEGDGPIAAVWFAQAVWAISSGQDVKALEG